MVGGEGVGVREGSETEGDRRGVGVGGGGRVFGVWGGGGGWGEDGFVRRDGGEGGGVSDRLSGKGRYCGLRWSREGVVCWGGGCLGRRVGGRQGKRHF